MARNDGHVRVFGKYPTSRSVPVTPTYRPLRRDRSARYGAVGVLLFALAYTALVWVLPIPAEWAWAIALIGYVVGSAGFWTGVWWWDRHG